MRDTLKDCSNPAFSPYNGSESSVDSTLQTCKKALDNPTSTCAQTGLEHSIPIALMWQQRVSLRPVQPGVRADATT